MAFNDGFLTEEQRQLLRSASQGRDSACSLISPKSSGSEQEHHVKYGAGSAKNHGAVPPGKYVKRSHSGKLGCPKKGGSGGKGTWGGLLDTAGDLQVDRKDPNYDSEEEGRGGGYWRIRLEFLNRSRLKFWSNFFAGRKRWRLLEQIRVFEEE